MRHILLILALASIATAQTTIRTNLGTTTPYTDGAGHAWTGNAGCVGGSNFSTATTIGKTTDQALYNTAWTGATITCTYAVTPGDYTVTLKFADLSGTGRRQSISINGVTVLSELAVGIVAGGAFVAYDLTYELPSNGSTITIVTAKEADSGYPYAILNALQILPGLPTTFTGPTLVKTTKSASVTVPYRCRQGTTCDTVLLPGAQGSVTSAGRYTAPANPTRHGSIAGCPMLPHNNIYNMRIDGAPLHADSDAYIASLASTSNMSYAYKNIYASWPGATPNKFTTAGTPVYSWKEYNTKASYTAPLATPPSYPGFGSKNDPWARAQSAWGVKFPVNTINSNLADNHYHGVLVDGPNQCQFTEYYQFVLPSQLPFDWAAVGAGSTQCPDCNARSMAQFDAGSFTNMMSGSGSTVAMNTPLIPMQFSQSELRTAAAQPNVNDRMIKHALALTFSNGAIQGKVSVWPSIGSWTITGGIVPYGTRLRLKASFKICGDPDAGTLAYPDCYDATRDTANVRHQEMIKAELRTFKVYGGFVMDGTSPSTAWGLHARNERSMDPDVITATDLLTMSPQLKDYALIRQFEAIDESGYMTDLASNVVRAESAQPETVALRENGVIVDYRDISVMPPALGGFRAQLNAVAGTIVNATAASGVFATGLSDNTAFRWTVRDCVTNCGTVDQTTGVYTAPATVAAPQYLTLRVEAAEDPSLLWEIRVVLLPAVGNGLYLAFGGNQGNVLDPSGRRWWTQEAGAQATAVKVNIMATKNGFAGVATVADPSYPSIVFSGGSTAEQVQSVFLPNGTYNLKFLINTGSPAAEVDWFGDRGQNAIEINGAVALQADFHSAAYGNSMGSRGIVVGPLPATVSNGELILGWKIINANTWASFAGLSIEPASASTTAATPFVGGTANVSGTVYIQR